jgi:hypothetical protein
VLDTSPNRRYRFGCFNHHRSITMNATAIDTQEPAAEQQPTSHVERSGKGPSHIEKVGHGVTVKAWQKTGKHGDYHEIIIEQAYKVGEEWKTAKVKIPNGVVPGLIVALAKMKTEFVDREMPPSQALTR